MTITFKDLSTNGNAIPILRLGPSGGLSAEGYVGRTSFIVDNVPPVVNGSATGFLLGDSWTASVVLSGAINLYCHSKENNIWAMKYILSREDLGQMVLGAGLVDLIGPLERVGFLTTDSFDDGRVTIQYE